MQKSRWLLALLVAVAFFSCGCDSSPSDTVKEKVKSVFSSFITDGAVVVRNNAGEIIPNATGTITNSRLTLNLSEPEPPRPFIVEVESGTFINGQQLQTPLSRVVEPGDDLDEIFITSFSTIKALAYLQAVRLGQENPLEVGNTAMAAVFDSLGLQCDIQAEELENICPVSNDTRVVQLEFAQQALFLVLNVSDVSGLTGFRDALQAPVLDQVASLGSEFTARVFTSVARNEKGDGPAKQVQQNREQLEHMVRHVFSEAEPNISPFSRSTVELAMEKVLSCGSSESVTISSLSQPTIHTSDCAIMYSLTIPRLDRIATIGPLSYGDGNSLIDAGTHALGEPYRDMPLAKQFSVQIQTWRALAGGASATTENPDKVILYHIGNSEGGFLSHPADLPMHQLEINNFTLADGQLDFTLTDEYLRVVTEGDDSRIEQVNLKVVYLNSGREIPVFIAANRGLVFHSPEER